MKIDLMIYFPKMEKEPENNNALNFKNNNNNK